MSDPLGPVVITGREIYDQGVRLAAAIADLGTRVDRLADAHDDTKERLVDVKSNLLDHETRIRGLERGRWPLPSAAIVVSMAGLIYAIVTRS